MGSIINRVEHLEPALSTETFIFHWFFYLFKHTIESMASSSCCASNSQRPRWNVFLSFRGEDTRKTFTGHLYKSLENKGIYTFQDDKRLDHGTPISTELFKAIEQAQVALIIFSKNYASSTWCLDELVKIMECKKINQYGESSVIPIFYDVDPSIVRHQRESFGEALEKHESMFKVNDDVDGMQKVQRWRAALTAAANLKGYDIRQGIEADWIQQLVDQISSRFRKTSLSYLQNIVGISTHLEKVKSLLKIEINDIRIVGIWGMGGVGKTTITKAIFDTLSDQYEVASFLEDVKENKGGMHVLQNILLSELLGEKDNCVNNKEVGKDLLSERLRFKKVLVVLDDIDHRDHLDYLAGALDWFGCGSRIIVTTRDRHLMGKNVVYEVTTLVKHEALQLFNQHAFKKEHPDESFKDLAMEVVSHAKGLPLALKVLGCHLHNRDINEWRSAITEMRKNSNSEIVDKLKISYDGLEPIQKEMFLDLACFFRGKKRGGIKPILESCDFEVDIGLRVLIDKYLVFISDKDTIEMHDYIQEMGKYVVNMQKDPGKCSRLWLAKDVEEVMENNTGTDAIKAIWIPFPQEITITKEALNNMRNLRILDISLKKDKPNCINGSIEYLSNKLRWLVWRFYPWESFPANFEPKGLVFLKLFGSSLCYLWTERKDLRYLRMLNLTLSKRLKRTPDFTGMPNLKYLYLVDCKNLEAVDHSLGRCGKLIWLNLSGCLKLESLPEEIGDLENLERLDASRTAISQPPSSIVRLNNLKFLSFRKCYDSKVHFVFPNVSEGLRSLESLDLSYCNLIDGGLPEDIGCLSSLKELYLEDNDFEHLPRSIAQLGALRALHLPRCYNLTELRELPPALFTLNAEWKRDSIYNSFTHALFQNLSSKQHDITTSDSLSQRMFTIEYKVGNVKIPSWFHYQGSGITVSANLPKDWFLHDNFLGFAVCYDGILVETTVHLIPLCDDGEMSWMTQKLALHNYSKHYTGYRPLVHFFYVPLTGLWDTSKANGKTPNDYRHIQLYFSGDIKKFGLRLLYKEEHELESEDNDECEPESEDKDECEPESEDKEEPELESEDNDECEPESEDKDEPQHVSLIEMVENNDEPACCSLGHSLKSMKARLLRFFSNKSRDQSLQNR